MERRARTKSKLIVGRPKEKEIKGIEGREVNREAESRGRETRRMIHRTDEENEQRRKGDMRREREDATNGRQQ